MVFMYSVQIIVTG